MLVLATSTDVIIDLLRDVLGDGFRGSDGLVAIVITAATTETRPLIDVNR